MKGFRPMPKIVLPAADCEQRCPFDVPVIERMEKAKTLFGI